MSTVEDLTERVRSHFANAGPANLQAISVEPVLNWGGFVNRSFCVSDGHSRFFVKLGSDPKVKRGLRRWRRLADRLSLRYHAPRMVGWLDLNSSFSGPIFEWIDGATPAILTPSLATEISIMLQDLHTDRELARWLGKAGDTVQTCAQSYLRSYHQRFIEDLEFIAAAPPPFVSSKRLEWMRRQVQVMEAQVSESPAFLEPADCPIHADLWLNNILVAAAGTWYVLDWDGLELGDPIMEWSMLFGP